MLKKELLELCLLHLLLQEDRYGYEMLSRLHTAFPDTPESAIYALLRELCRQGFTRQYRGEVSGGPTRKYYALTEQGLKRYRALLKQWQALRTALEELGVDQAPPAKTI